MLRKGTDKHATSAAGHRCAIYTRKSSEEGLEQEFNSLDAQREACEAYIKSQKGVGWIALADMYDDGGTSGGTMQRPALQRLLSDIAAGRIDTVVVYKVDRLTRSLSDFAKIVDTFDTKGVAFVSVTQQFNTTTSMGRLTLNMLLSFAQFEREVTGERIRDKIAASKKRGMWMGGLPPLGYDVEDRKLVVNAREAETVRHIFTRYAALKSVRLLKEELDEAGTVSKARSNKFGDAVGAKPIARGALYLMLQNQIYRGEIVHKKAAYPGLHDPIIDEDSWTRAQTALTENRVENISRSKAASPSLLAGLVFDQSDERMSPTHATKNGARYRYYVSQSLIKRGRPKASTSACRLPAADLESLVEARFCAVLRDEAVIFKAVGSASVGEHKATITAALDLARRWPALPAPDRREILLALIGRVAVLGDRVEIIVRLAAMPRLLHPRGEDETHEPSLATDLDDVVLSVPAHIKRTGIATKLVIQGDGSATRSEPDRSLLRLIAQAHRFNKIVMENSGLTVTEPAKSAGVSRSYFARVFRLSFLAPDITKAILQNRHPAEFTAHKLMRAGSFARPWADQRRQFGFD